MKQEGCQGIFSWSVNGDKFSLWNSIYNLLSSWTGKIYIFVMRYFMYIFFVICHRHPIFSWNSFKKSQIYVFFTELNELQIKQRIVSFCINRPGIEINKKWHNFNYII